MNAAVHDVEVGDRKPGVVPSGRSACQRGRPAEQGDGACRSHRHPDDGVGTEAGLRCGPVELDDRPVQLRGSANDRPTSARRSRPSRCRPRRERPGRRSAGGRRRAARRPRVIPSRLPTARRRERSSRRRASSSRRGWAAPASRGFRPRRGPQPSASWTSFPRNDPSFLDEGPAHQGTTSRFADNTGPSPAEPTPAQPCTRARASVISAAARRGQDVAERPDFRRLGVPAGLAPEKGVGWSPVPVGARRRALAWVATRAGHGCSMAASRPVGGILSPERNAPGGDHPSMRPTWGHRAGSPSHAWPCSGWGLPSRSGHPDRWCALTAPFHPCLCLAAIGGLLSVALSFGSPRLAVSQHPALRSPDLPRTRWGPPRPRPPGRLAAGSIVALAVLAAIDVSGPRRRSDPRVALSRGVRRRAGGAAVRFRGRRRRGLRRRGRRRRDRRSRGGAAAADRRRARGGPACRATWRGPVRARPAGAAGGRRARPGRPGSRPTRTARGPTLSWIPTSRVLRRPFRSPSSTTG